ncbi:LysR family transcriptional regulator [Burkholderia sp. AU28863]|uniref:LysR family transcriptional regulator n=1 Tax=Burkholderia sp. AU28863 TaxID=2015352 RepID=UPI000B79E5EA|nr:LysR substrate-binding domain-containing protein [Burkholderia sp. AU28863]OXI64823.1 LysR family transcriptional regulator [Burkholderia sp. AU28863]
MNIPLLETFRAVVQEGSALRAAERLGCTQSNVTARLRQLEESLDAPLFDRRGKRLVLNDAGRRLMPYCDRILRLVDEATQVVRETPVARSVRLGSMESTAATRLPALAAALKERDPALGLAVQIGSEPDLADALLRGRIDAALTARAVVRPGLHYEPAFAEDMVLVSAATVTRRQLLADNTVRLLAFHDGCPYRAVAEHWLKARGVAIESVSSFGTFGAILGCVAAGMGVAILPKRITTEHVARKELRTHAFDDLDSVTTYLVTPDEAPALPELDALRAVLGRQAGALLAR